MTAGVEEEEEEVVVGDTRGVRAPRQAATRPTRDSTSVRVGMGSGEGGVKEQEGSAPHLSSWKRWTFTRSSVRLPIRQRVCRKPLREKLGSSGTEPAGNLTCWQSPGGSPCSAAPHSGAPSAVQPPSLPPNFQMCTCESTFLRTRKTDPVAEKSLVLSGLMSIPEHQKSGNASARAKTTRGACVTPSVFH
jgi:hypothetical protein